MRGGILQMGCRPSKDDNDAASMYMHSETDSDYIAQAKIKIRETPDSEVSRDAHKSP